MFSKSASSKPSRTPDEIVESDYSLSGAGRILTYTVPIGLFFLAFLMTVQIGSISGFLRSQLKTAVPGCPLSVSEVDFGFFLPRVILNNVVAPPRCFAGKTKGNSISLKSLEVGPRGLSFSPFGVILGATIQGFGQNVYARVVPSPSKQVVKISEQKIKIAPLLEAVTPFIGNPNLTIPQMNGTAEVSAEIVNGKRSIEALDVRLNSKKLNIAQANLMGFVVPSVALSHLDLVVNGNMKNIAVKKAEIGKTGDDLYARVTGNIKPNGMQLSNRSSLDLTIELKLGGELGSTLQILSMLLGKYKTNDGGYKFKLGGTMGAPKPMPL